MTDPGNFIDQSVIAKMRGEVGSDTLPILVEALKKEIHNAKDVLDGAMILADWHQIEVQAHAMKSASRTFGAMELGQACQDLEYLAKDMIASENKRAPLPGDISAAIDLCDQTLAAFEVIDIYAD